MLSFVVTYIKLALVMDASECAGDVTCTCTVTVQLRCLNPKPTAWKVDGDAVAPVCCMPITSTQTECGVVVTWTSVDLDLDVPLDHAGKVVAATDSDGRTRVEFDNGTWKFKTKGLRSCGYSVGDYVTWGGSDSDVPTGGDIACCGPLQVPHYHARRD